MVAETGSYFWNTDFNSSSVYENGKFDTNKVVVLFSLGTGLLPPLRNPPLLPRNPPRLPRKPPRPLLPPLLNVLLLLLLNGCYTLFPIKGNQTINTYGFDPIGLANSTIIDSSVFSFFSCSSIHFLATSSFSNSTNPYLPFTEWFTLNKEK